MDSCPVCYVTFSTTQAEDVARKLPCEHVACTQCLEDCFEEASERGDKTSPPEGPGVRCPECFTLFPFNSVQEVPVWDWAGAEPKEDAPEQDDPESSRESGGGSASPGDTGEPRKSSKLAAFLSTNKAESHIPTFTEATDTAAAENGGHGAGAGEGGGGAMNGRMCKVQGCLNQAVQDVAVCPVHARRLSVVSVSAMVHKFKDTKLSSVALKSDKVEVNRGGVAGAGEAGFDPDAIAQRFRRQERLELGEAVALIEATKNIFREEKNMVELDAPVMVVGDVHGQYFDLLNILKKWRPDHNLLFLGDYVDRGQFSCEVILHLFALKLRYPDKVHLIRGNHECSSVSAHFGFKDECKAKYGLTVYYRFLLAFQTMPICALIATSIGRIFACHGGISPDIKHLSEIEDIDRFVEPEMESPLCDMLWADPMNEDDSHKLTDAEYQTFLDTDFVANQVRGCSYMFGYHAVQRFLRDNRLMYMVRAHEVQEEGFRSHFPSPAWALAAAAAAAEGDDFTDEDSDLDSEEEEDAYDQVLADTTRHLNPTVLTVFSAPNYCDRYHNKAAVLHIEKLGYYTVNLLEAEPHPDPVMESDVNVMQTLAMGNTCPYMPTSFREFLKVAVELGRAVKPTSTNNSSVTEDLVNAAAAADAFLREADGEDDTEACRGRGGIGPSPLSRKKDSEDGIREKERQDEENRKKKVEEEDKKDKRKNDEEGAVEEDGEEDEEEDPSKVMPSFAPRDRRGTRRIASSPMLVTGGSGRQNSASSTGNGSSWDDRRQADGSAGAFSARGGVDGKGNPPAPTEEPAMAEARTFLGAMSSFSRRSMRGLGLLDARASSPGLGLLSRQNTWAGGTPRPESSEHYRRAHARDGINEMHPEVLNRRISSQESGEMEAAAERAGMRSPVPSASSTASVTPTATPEPILRYNGPTLEGLLFGPSGLGGSSKNFSPAPAEGRAPTEEGDYVEPSPAPEARGVHRQFSLDLSMNTPSPHGAPRAKGNKSQGELAALLSNSSITELAEMEGDVEVEIEPTDSESGCGSLDHGHLHSTPSFQLSAFSSSSRRTSFELDGMMTPSPRSRRGSVGDAASPSQILFTHEEIVVLKLLFSLFDRKGKNFITRDDIVAYAEEGGDFAQLKEVDACMEAIDADVDGKVGLSDYINFAARLKGIHALQQQQQQRQQQQKGQTTPAHQYLPEAGGDSSPRTTPPQHSYSD